MCHQHSVMSELMMGSADRVAARTGALEDFRFHCLVRIGVTDARAAADVGVTGSILGASYSYA